MLSDPVSWSKRVESWLQGRSIITLVPVLLLALVVPAVVTTPMPIPSSPTWRMMHHRPLEVGEREERAVL